MLIRADRSFLLVVDIQAKLAPHIDGAAAAIGQTMTIIKAARRLGVPVLACEENPPGLGPTVPEVADLLPEGVTHPKMHFACLANPGWPERIAALGRRQAVLCGMETHVCVLQSALSLKEAGYATFVVADATSSRHAESRHLGLERLRAEGVGLVTTEMVVFEWLGQAGTDEFRELLALIK